MKFPRLKFLRFIFWGLIIILQIAIWFIFSYYLYENYFWVNIAFRILSILAILLILNKDVPMSSKVGWIFVVSVIPFIGLILYMVLGNVNMSKKNKKNLIKERKFRLDFANNYADNFSLLKEENERMYGEAKYISSTVRVPLFKDNHSEYLNEGTVFFARLKEELKKAEHYILMEYFIIEEGKMWNEIHQILIDKVKEGVDVYFLYDDVGCVSKIPGNYYKKLVKEGIKCAKFNKLTFAVATTHNNRDHRKITVVDGNIGFVSGANLADEYININSKFGYWKDNGILLKGEIVKSLIILFSELYNISSPTPLDISSLEIFKKNKEKEYSTGYTMVYDDGPRPVYPDYVGKNVYLNIINYAKKYIYITTPYLIVDYEFIEALCIASKRGVNIKIILPSIADKKLVNILTKSNYEKLVRNGIEIYEINQGFIHQKTFVCDDTIATVSTINLDYRSFLHHYECGVWMYNTECIPALKEDVLKYIEAGNRISLEQTKLNVFKKLIKLILNIFAPLL